VQSAGVLSAKASAEPYWKRGLSKRKPEEYQRGVLDANAKAKGYWNTAATAKAVMTGLSFAQLDEKIDTAALAANSPSACAKANCARADANGGTCADTCCCTSVKSEKIIYADGNKFAKDWVGTKKDAPHVLRMRAARKKVHKGKGHFSHAGNTKKHQKKLGR